MVVLRALVILPVLALCACGPMSVETAERECFERARLASQPRGMVSIGAGSSGQMAGGLDLSISSDWVQGRDPAAVYETCVVSKSGEAPRRPLYQRSDWKG